MQEIIRIGVFRKSAGHGANHSHIIDVFSCLRKQITNRNSTLAVLLKLPWAGQSIPDVIELSGLNLCRERFAVFFVQARFRVERIDL